MTLLKQLQKALPKELKPRAYKTYLRFQHPAMGSNFDEEIIVNPESDRVSALGIMMMLAMIQESVCGLSVSSGSAMDWYAQAWQGDGRIAVSGCTLAEAVSKLLIRLTSEHLISS